MPYLSNYFTEITLTLIAVAIIALGWFILDLRNKWNHVFRNKPTHDALGDVLQRIARVEHTLADFEPRLKTIEDIGRVAVQKIGFLRFNPFQDTGGDQSFAIALLDHENNGFVISSLYAREGVRTYAKEIQSGQTRHQLSNEEQHVLEQAMANERHNEN